MFRPLHHPLLPPIFGLDTRSLGLSRVALGLTLLLSEASIMEQQGWQLWGVALVIVTVAFTLGLATRPATFLTWIGHFYLIRTSSMPDHGMLFAHNMLFYGFFLPLGERISLDASRTTKPVAPRTILSYASCAWVLQIFFVYLSAGMTKDPAIWLWNPTAVQRILAGGPFPTQFGSFIGSFPLLTAIATLAVYGAELFLPFALLVPDPKGRFRAFVAIFFILFHLALAVTMKLDAFPFTCIALWISLIPFRYFMGRATPGITPAPLTVIEPGLGDRLVALAILHMIVANERVMFGFLDAYQPGSPMWFFTKVLGLKQMWVMFNIVTSG